jgi:molybdenum-dependent DNA-binding transcriptional regulator ModE
MDGTKLPLSKWLQGYCLLSGEITPSVRQFAAQLGVPIKTAWKLMRRIRELIGNQGVPTHV